MDLKEIKEIVNKLVKETKVSDGQDKALILNNLLMFLKQNYNINIYSEELSRHYNKKIMFIGVDKEGYLVYG